VTLPDWEWAAKSKWVKAERRYPLVPRESKRWRADAVPQVRALEERVRPDALRVLGLAKVALQTDLTMLARFSAGACEAAGSWLAAHAAPSRLDSRALMRYTANEREPRSRRVVTSVGAVVAVALAILLVLDIFEKGETIAGDLVFWAWFVSTVALLGLGVGILLTGKAVRYGALAIGMALLSFGVWALVAVVIL